ncbi:hypothetical protein J2S03_002508 [Alicyclobacillus cycloheptanicus]|uniref:Uncharacterized protein n=1 Tax=Alicyclobacillus cycloheptanicus TaxID=1457 RepID=A0ABT9XK18_9BACL|nr:hypothetical protein [Alicyclobacillus cycloheptanicus]
MANNVATETPRIDEVVRTYGKTTVHIRPSIIDDSINRRKAVLEAIADCFRKEFES